MDTMMTVSDAEYEALVEKLVGKKYQRNLIVAEIENLQEEISEIENSRRGLPTEPGMYWHPEEKWPAYLRENGTWTDGWGSDLEEVAGDWEITFDGKNTRAIQALVGRMQNRDGDVDQVRFYLMSSVTPELGGYVWIEDQHDLITGENSGGWVDVEVGDTISKIGSMWVPKYGDSPVFRVTKGESEDV